MRPSALHALLAWLLAACAPQPGPPPASAVAPAGPIPLAAAPWEAHDLRRAATDGEALVAWRPRGGALPRNRHFELELWVLRDGAPVRGAELIVRADMPAHGHGMNVEPRALPQDDGSYLVRGMLLHMAGEWELGVHVIERGRTHAAVFALEVE